MIDKYNLIEYSFQTGWGSGSVGSSGTQRKKREYRRKPKIPGAGNSHRQSGVGTSASSSTTVRLPHYTQHQYYTSSDPSGPQIPMFSSDEEILTPVSSF